MYNYNNPCPQYKQVKESSSFFIILKVFSNVNTTILRFLFFFNDSEINWYFMIKRQIDKKKIA